MELELEDELEPEELGLVEELEPEDDLKEEEEEMVLEVLGQLSTQAPS